jgi:hypothetical protein
VETYFDTLVEETVPDEFKFENFDISCADPDKTGLFTIELIHVLSGKVLSTQEFPVLLMVAP